MTKIISFHNRTFTTPEEAVENLVEFLQKEHRYELEQIEMIVRGDFREALEDKYGEDYDG